MDDTLKLIIALVSLWLLSLGLSYFYMVKAWRLENKLAKYSSKGSENSTNTPNKNRPADKTSSKVSGRG